jgi:predicted nucleic acid-binding Zn ribbon protein
MQHKSAQSIGEIISQFVKEMNLGDKLNEKQALEAWRELVGKGILRYTESVFIKNRVLYVKLTSSTLRNELQMNREIIINRLNDKVGTKVIDNIIFN